ncbi:N-acetyl-alpha-D-glucosaminyl L-malate synthase BshA [Bacteroidia bacterium]|nr:N-acetyl-alpha-D-glucosaminyl L-malate synthase BshA [Bacteroidia bacterium]MDA9213737.1 N-acetyl-alpha-D-glucosaminyl L-malate synthase BshA [Bacteroidia bacterium]
MRIGMVLYPTFGGSGVLATELGKALAKIGHEIHFISYRQPARLEAFLENVFFHEVSIPKYPLFDYAPYETALAGKIVEIVRSNKLDLLHVHYAIPHASAALLAKQILAEDNKYIPVLTTLHGTDITLVGREASYEPVVNWSINNSDAVTAVSKSLVEDTLEHFQVKREVLVIPNFIDFDRFNKKPKEHFKKAIAPNNEKILVHTSNFRKVKRVDDVIRLFHIVQHEIPSKLLLIGDGPERSNIEKTCRELKVCDKVTFLGKQEAIEEILSVCDLFILPSERESFGLSALEAMACEVPVISTNAGGLAEVNIHGKTGYTSEIGNYEEMAQFALDLLQNDKKLESFRHAALEQAKKFNLEDIRLQYIELYKKLIKP